MTETLVLTSNGYSTWRFDCGDGCGWFLTVPVDGDESERNPAKSGWETDGLDQTRHQNTKLLSAIHNPALRAHGFRLFTVDDDVIMRLTLSDGRLIAVLRQCHPDTLVFTEDGAQFYVLTGHSWSELAAVLIGYRTNSLLSFSDDDLLRWRRQVALLRMPDPLVEVLGEIRDLLAKLLSRG